MSPALIRPKPLRRKFRITGMLESYWRIIDHEFADPHGAAESVKGMDDLRVRFCGIPSVFS